nr:leucine-rich repeat domain-containing protein [Clostridia bacterium]
AFAYSKMNTVIIGSGVEEIGSHAFDYCDTLQYAILGEYDASEGKITKSSLMVIGEYAFANCERLEKIDIPSTVEKINTYAFNNSALYKNAGNGVAYAGNWIVGCDNTKARGTIKIEEGTVGIANYAFFKCSNITAVEIPDSVKTIGRSAFYQCESLTSVRLPSALKTIEDYTFYGCTNLSMPTLPVTLEYIGRSAFYKCALRNPEGDTASDTLVIPNSVQTIGDYAFYASGYTDYDMDNFQIRNGGIDVVIIGNAVKSIGNNAFYATPTLKKVVLGNSVQSIGSRAFYKCETLSEFVFNDSLQHIGERAFFGCSSLKNVSLPYGLTSVDDYSFYKCEGLEVVTLGANTQRIGDYAFYGCKNLKTLNLPVSLKSIGKQAFRACTGLTSIVLGSNVTSISEHAFYGCKQLTIYAEDTKAQDGWNERFNSGYRPVVWGCMVQDGYVYSVTKSAGNVRIPNSNDSLSAPQRDGYVFLGWSTTEGSDVAEYTAQGLKDVNDGTKVYSVWKSNDTNEQ